jgi:hypothetical protein
LVGNTNYLLGYNKFDSASLSEASSNNSILMSGEAQKAAAASLRNIEKDQHPTIHCNHEQTKPFLLFSATSRQRLPTERTFRSDGFPPCFSPFQHAFISLTAKQDYPLTFASVPFTAQR